MTNRKTTKVSLGVMCAVIAFALVFAMTFAFAPAKNAPTAYADDTISYVSRSWDGATVVDSEKSISTYTVVASGTTSWTDGWYVVTEDVTIGSRVTVSGTANLILCDGATLTAEKGIEVSSGNTLNVYAQSTGENMGAIVATGTGNAAAIGGGYGGTGGNVNIHGGVITATGDEGAAGIGGGDCGNGGNVNIYGGIITATGDEHAGGGCGGAGIGGGEYCNGGNVNIYGGVITATGGEGAAGIGGGDAGSSNGALTVAEGYVVYGGTSADPTTVIEKSNNDYARYQYMIVTVPVAVLAYSANGATSGSVPTDATEYELDDTVTVLGNTGNLVNGSFTFVGWNTEADGTGTLYTAGATFNITQDTTLYATWRSFKIVVTNDGDDTMSAFVLNDNVTYNEGGTYNFTRDGQAKSETIAKVYTGCGNAVTGAMTNYENYFDTPWYEDYATELKYVFIGSNVTHVGNYAFQNFGSFTHLTLSEGLVTIGIGAFGQSRLENPLCLPNTLTTIGQEAFAVNRMIIVKFGTGLITIGDRAFYNCDQLVIGGQGVSLDLDDYYNDYPDSPKNEDSIVLTLPSSLTTIGGSAFEDCDALKKVVIPNSVNSMGSGVFEYCDSINQVTWGTGLNTIPSSTFEECSALTSFTIPASVTEIGMDAFKSSGLTSITIPATVEEVGYYAFSGCENLATVVFASKDTILGNNYVFDGVGSSSDCKALTLPSDWDKTKLPAIADGEWYGGYFTLSPKLTPNVTAPTAITSEMGESITLINAGSAVGGTMQYKVGSDSYSESLPTANAAGTYTVYYKVVGDRNHNDVEESSIEVTIYAVTYDDNDATSGTVPTDANLYASGATVTVLGNTGNLAKTGYGFNGWNTLANGTGASYAVGGTFTISEDTTLYVRWCTLKVVEVHCEDSYTALFVLNDEKTYAGFDAFEYHSGGINYTGEVVHSYDNCGDAITGAMNDYTTASQTPWYVVVAQTRDVVIGSGVTHVGNYAFYGSSFLLQLSLSEGVETIGDYAFYNAGSDGDSFTTLSLPNSLTTIGDYAFANTNLHIVKFGTGLESIGDYAFSGCSKLAVGGQSVTLDVGDYFDMDIDEPNETDDVVLTLPSNVTTIGESAFQGCSRLLKVVIPSSVNSVGSEAFSGVGALNDRKILTLPTDWSQNDLPDPDTGEWRSGYFTLNPKFASSVSAAPTAVANLAYTGSAQTLISAGTASGGTMQYKVGRGAYSENLPQAINAGTFTVYYKVVGDNNHNDSVEDSLEVTIATTASTGIEIVSAYLDGTDTDIIVDSNSGGYQEQPGGSSGDWIWYSYTSVERSSYKGTNTAFFTGSPSLQYKNTAMMRIKAVEVIVSDCYEYNIFGYTSETQNSLQKVRSGENEIIRLVFSTAYESALTISFVNQAGGTNTFHLVGIRVYTQPHDIFTFDKDGGEGGDDSVLCYQGDFSDLINVTPPTKDGYIFGGYYDEGYNTKYFNSNGRYCKTMVYNTLEGNKTLYAKWLLAMTVSATGFTGEYDGNNHSITVTVTEPSSDYTITYKGEGASSFDSENPTYSAIGVYVVNFKVVDTNGVYGEYNGSATITIEKMTPVYTAPTPKVLTYTNGSQELIEGGDTNDGVMKYSLDGETWLTDIPEGEEVGSYTVYFKIFGDETHKDLTDSIVVTIGKATPSPVYPEDTITVEYWATLSTAVGLPAYWSWVDSTTRVEEIPGSTPTYSAIYTPDDTEHYNTVESVLEIFVTDATLNVTVAQSGKYIFTGEEQQVDVTKTETVANNISVTYEFSDDGYTYQDTMPYYLYVGEYTVYYIAHAQYHEDAEGSFKVTIGKSFAFPDFFDAQALYVEYFDPVSYGVQADESYDSDYDIGASFYIKDYYTSNLVDNLKYTFKFTLPTEYDPESTQPVFDPEYTKIYRYNNENNKVEWPNVIDANGNVVLDDYENGERIFIRDIRPFIYISASASPNNITYGDEAQISCAIEGIELIENPVVIEGETITSLDDVPYETKADFTYICQAFTSYNDIKAAGNFFVNAQYTWDYDNQDYYNMYSVKGYRVIPGSSGNLTVAPKTIGISWGSTSLSYTGYAQAPNVTPTGIVDSDEVTFTITGKEIEVGTGYTATITGISNDNYVLPSTNLTREFSIEKANLDFSVSIEDWEYGADQSSISYTGIVGNGNKTVYVKKSGDPDTEYQLMTESYPTAVGSYVLKVEIAETGSYNYGEATTTFSIEKADINPNIEIEGWAYGSEANTPVITGNVDGGSVTCYYKLTSQEDEAYSETVPTDAGNYTIKIVIGETDNYNGETLTDTFTIAQKAITVTGITASDKEYDGSTDATLVYTNMTISGKVGEDNITVSATGTFNNKNVGTEKTVSIGDWVISGADADNYCIKNDSQENTTANVSKRSVIVSGIIANSKAYDGNTTATLDYDDVYFERFIDGDKLSISATGTFADANYSATAINVSITNLVLGGDDAGNYILADNGQQAQTTAYINKKEIVISGITAENKTYDKTTSATLVLGNNVVYGGIVDGENLTVSATGTFADANYSEEAITVNITNLTLGGTDIANYVLANDGQQTSTTAYILKRTVGISWGSSEFTFDDSEKVPTATATNVCDGDEVELTVSGGQTNAGNDYEAMVVGISNNNYALPEEENRVCQFSIAKADINFTVSIANWIYGNDIPNAYLSGSYGNGTKTYWVKLTSAPDEEESWTLMKAVNPNKYPVDVGNYDLKVVSESNSNYNAGEARTTFTISVREIIVSNIKVDNKTYDGNTNATFNYDDVVLTGKVEGDDLSVVATGAFADKNVENGKTIVFTSLALDGAKKDNYVLKAGESVQQSYATANIVAKEIVVSGITVDNKVYDGTTVATFNYTSLNLDGNLDGANLSAVATGTFENKNVEDNKVVEFTLELTGSEKDNYVLKAGESVQQSYATANIVAKEIVVSGITVDNKVYDGTTVATFNYTSLNLDGNLDGANLSVVATGAFENKNVANGKTVEFTLALSGNEKDNYVLKAGENVQQSSATANITIKEIIVSGITVDNKIYDGTTAAAFNYSTVVLDGNLDGENLSVVATGSFADKNVANGKIVEFTLALSGNEKDNYVLKAGESVQQSYATANIVAREIVVSGIKVDNKVYDGTTVATFNYTSVVLDGNLDGENLSVVVTGTFANKNVENEKAVDFTMVLSGSEKANYVLAEAGQQTFAIANITAKEIIVSGITVDNKVYDGTTAATFNYTGVNLTGNLDGENLSVVATGAFENKNVANGKTVEFTLALSGNEKDNYVLKAGENVQQSSATANITIKEIIVSGITVDNKIYDGTTAAAFNYSTVVLDGNLDGENLSVIATGTFADKNVANGKTVEFTLALSGNEKDNYVLKAGESVQQSYATANIVAKEIVVSGITVDNKVYDGTTVATFNYTSLNLDGNLDGANLSAVATGTFETKNVEDNKVVEFTLELTGSEKDNYVLKAGQFVQQFYTNANITAKEIVVSGITVDNKVYDGTTDVTFNYTGVTLDGNLDGEDLSVVATGAFENKNVANGKTVVFTSLTLTGDEKDNYVLKVGENVQQTSATANITAKEIVVSGITVDNKVYDGTTAAAFNYSTVVLDGNLDGENLSVVATGSFADKNVANGKTVEFTLALSGSEKDNYVLKDGENVQQTSATANIIVKEIVVSGITVDNKVYDATTAATFNYSTVVLDGNLDGENLSVVATGSFANKNVENGKTVEFTLALSGSEKDNYVLKAGESVQQTFALANITAIPVKVTGLTVENRVYNGNNEAIVICTEADFDGIIAGDELIVSTTGTFDNKNVGENKTITFGELILSGEDAGNYYVDDDSQGTTTANITAKEIVVSGITAEDKVYDGTTTPEFNYDEVILTGNLDGENLSVVATGSFDNKNIGEDKEIVFTLTLTGEEKDNYILSEEDQQTLTTATIEVKEIVVSGIAVDNKVYDGTTVATFNYTSAVLDGNCDGENLSVVATGAFANSIAENGKVVAFELALTGSEKDNYVLAESGQQFSATANITAKPITVTIVNKTSVYGDEPVALSATTEAGAIEDGDSAPYTLSCEVTAESNAGFYDIIGAGVSDNYAVTFANEENAYEVTKLPITAVAQYKVINYAQDEPSYTFTILESIPQEVLDEFIEKISLTCDVDTTIPGRYTIKFEFVDGYTTMTVLQNYAVTLEDAELTVNKHYEIDNLIVDGLDPDDEYEVSISITTPEDNDNIKKADISVVKKNEGGEDEQYTDEADLTVTIPELIDPNYFELYTEDEDGNEELVDSDKYVITEDGKIIIRSIVPVRFVFKNKKGQIFVKAEDKKIHDGDNLPTYTFTVTGWDENGESLTAEVINTAKAAVAGSTNYLAGQTGVFSITTVFKQGKDEYTVINGYRVILDNATLTVLPKMISNNDVEVTLENADDAFDLDISLEVEIKTDIQTEESSVDYAAIAAQYVDRRSEISAVYAVTLLKTETVNGVETTTEIQPDEIKPGTVLIIKMAIPEHLIGRKFHILHIHSEEDVEYVDDSKVEIKDGFVYIKADRLSDFAFVNLKDNEEMGHKSFCIGWILFILDCIMLVYLVIYLIMKRRRILGLVGLIASSAVVVFGIVVISLHLCIITIVSFILAVLIFLAFLLLFLIGRKKDKEDKKEEKAVDEKKPVPVVAYVAGEPTTKDCYVIHPLPDGSFIYALYDHDGEIIAYSTNRFPSIEAAKASIEISRSTGEVVKNVEDRLEAEYETKENPKFDMYRIAQNEIYFGFNIADGSQIMHSVAYLNKKRCTQDLERAFVLVKAKQIIISELIIKNDVDKGKIAPTQEEIPEEKPIKQDEPVEEKIEEPIAEETPVIEETNNEVPAVEETPAEEEIVNETPTTEEEIAPIEEEPVEETPVEEGVSLKETLEVAKHTVSHSAVNKKYVTNYLNKYGDEVELNCRDNFTKTGLPLSDTHYAVRKDGKKVCFVYVYETASTVLLLRLDKDYAEKLIEKHSNVSKSAFPKSKDSWYSLVIDDNFSNEEIEQILNDAYEMAK